MYVCVCDREDVYDAQKNARPLPTERATHVVEAGKNEDDL